MSTMYLYNNTLAPALPEWDKTKYPYAIMRSYSSYENELLLYTIRPYYKTATRNDGSTIMFIYSGGICTRQHYNVVQGSYVYISEAEITASNALEVDEIPWTNFDLLDQDGNLYLAASEPVSTAGRITTYRYNDIFAPALPKWDKDKYPYAVINETPRLVIASICPTRYVGNYVTFPSAASYQIYKVTGSYFEFEEEGTSESVYVAGGDPKWANFELLDANGDLYISPTEPVYVYGHDYYLFNGIRLPGLPSHTESIYPYFHIDHATYGTWNLYAIDRKTYCYYYGKNTDASIYRVGRKRAIVENDEAHISLDWIYNPGKGWGFGHGDALTTETYDIDTLLWCNYDMHYLEAVEVPVETPDTETDTGTEGDGELAVDPEEGTDTETPEVETEIKYEVGELYRAAYPDPAPAPAYDAKSHVLGQLMARRVRRPVNSINPQNWYMNGYFESSTATLSMSLDTMNLPDGSLIDKYISGQLATVTYNAGELNLQEVNTADA